MKMRLIFFNILLVVLICGCAQKPEVEVTRDNVSKLDSSDLNKVYIICSAGKSDPNKGSTLYHYELPINPVKGHVILRCIMDANHTEYDVERFKRRHTDGKIDSGLFVFETKKLRYTTRIFWDDKSAYGFWWESPELLSIFKGWGLFKDLAKADPNWPPSHYQVQTTTRKIIEAGQPVEENK